MLQQRDADGSHDRLVQRLGRIEPMNFRAERWSQLLDGHRLGTLIQLCDLNLVQGNPPVVRLQLDRSFAESAIGGWGNQL